MPSPPPAVAYDWRTSLPAPDGAHHLTAAGDALYPASHHRWAHSGQSLRRSPSVIARWNAAGTEEYQAAEQHRLPGGAPALLENIFRLEPDADGAIAPGAARPFLRQEAWVAAAGRFNPCCAPDALCRTLGDFGNVNDNGLYAIWESEQYRELQANYMETPLCRGCNMRRPDVT